MGPVGWMVTLVAILVMSLSSGAPLNGANVCHNLTFKEAYFDGHPIPKVVQPNFALPLRCKAKYYDERTHSVCLGGDSWGPLNPPCRLIECPEIIASQNARLQVQGRGFNDTARFNCTEGYWYTGSKLRVCRRNGKWDGVDGKCEPVKCMRLPEIKNGQYRPPNYALTYHNQVYILCNHGYKYTGPFSSRTCQKNNEWSGIDGECVNINHVYCKIFNKGRHFVLKDVKEIWKYEEMLKVECEKGFAYNGTEIRQCLINSTWSGTVGVCNRILCASPRKIIQNGVLEKCAPCEYGKTLNVICNRGYVHTGKPISCLQNGMWTEGLQHCERVACKAYPVIEHGLWSVNGTMSGDEATLSCETGYTLVGTSKSVCEVNGQWSQPGKCMLIIASISKATYSVPKEVVESVVPCVFLVALLIAIWFSWKYRSLKKKKMQESNEERKPLLTIEDYKKAIMDRGHVIGRPTDKRIDLDKTFINLKMVDQAESEEKSLMGKVDYETYTSILGKLNRNEVAIDDILEKYNSSFLLLRGRAGVGKTTVLNKIMFDWAKSEKQWAKNYTVAIIFNTRYLSHMHQPAKHRACNLREFLEGFSLNEVSLPKDWEKEQQNILICIDGLDEFQFLRTRLEDDIGNVTDIAEPELWCIKILKREVLDKCMLVVTSRHFQGLKTLKPTKTIDLVGLMKKEVEEYISKHVIKNKVDKVKETIIEDNPILLSVCTITFFCMMVCRALVDGYKTINVGADFVSYTRITSLIFKKLIERNVTGTDQVYEESKNRSCISKLSRLAYQGLVEKDEVQVVFTTEDTNEAGLTQENIKVGLDLGLIIDSNLSYTSCNSGQDFVEFVHLSIQEILAITHLLTKNEETMRSEFRKMWTSKFFSGFALPHLFGLCYDTHDNIKELMGCVSKTFELARPSSVKDCLYEILKEKKTINRYERLCAIQMAYESHDKEIAKEVVNLLYGNKDTMTYIDVHLTAVDLKGIFFAAEHSKNIYKLEFIGLLPDDLCLEYVLEDLGKLLSKDKRITGIAFEGRKVTRNGLEHLLRALESNSTVKIISLEGTSLDDKDMEIVTRAMAKNNSVETLCLGRTKITKEAIRSLMFVRKDNESQLNVTCDQAVYESIMKEPEGDKNGNTNVHVLPASKSRSLQKQGSMDNS